MSIENADKNFLGIKNEPLGSAQLIVAPFGFEATTSYGHGAKNGATAIIDASAQVELFDDELWQETYKKVKIATIKTGAPAKSIGEAKKQIGEIIGNILAEGKLPITLGGEHSITPFIIATYKNAGFSNFSILQFDAHSDLRDGYEGEKYSHASAMRRCLDFSGVNLTQVGIRNISNENDELSFWEKNQKRIKTFWAHTKSANSCESAHANFNTSDILRSLKKNVYITFDVDVFDSSVMPATGTPEPGGPLWYEVIDILRAVCREKNIIGADFVELSPIKNFPAPDFMVAKLIYKMIGYIFQSKNEKVKT